MLTLESRCFLVLGRGVLYLRTVPNRDLDKSLNCPPAGDWQPYYGDPRESRSGYLFSGFPDYWFAPGARPHLHVPGVTKGRESVFKVHSAGHPLKRGGT